MDTTIKSINSEAGIIATVLAHPDFIFYSEQLRPNDFTDEQNAYIYWAVRELAKKGATSVDAYSILNVLNSRSATQKFAEKVTIDMLNEAIELSPVIARQNAEDYLIFVDDVRDKSFRRELLAKLKECESLCFEEPKLQTRVYETLDRVMGNYYVGDKVVPMSEKVDEMWAKLKQRQSSGGVTGYETKFPEARNYFAYDKSELVLVCGKRKEGKSMFCMNELKDKLEQGAKCLYIDSEMSDDQQYLRFLSHLAGVTTKAIKRGTYSTEEENRVVKANQWLKTHPYVHHYMTRLNQDEIYLLCKRLQNTGGLDFVVVDYIKSEGSIDSSQVYNALGEYTNFLKNRIAGELKLPVLAAAQLNRSGDIADSYKIEQAVSTCLVIRKKTDSEIARDGEQCGNYKLFVKLNRLGAQMDNIDNEYIDLLFSGNTSTFEQAKQQHDWEECSPW